jgi:hypothetical protein
MLVALTVAVSACDGSASQDANSDGEDASPSAASSDVPIRGCEASVYGTLPRGWRTTAVIAGPIAFHDLLNYTDPARFAARDGRWPGQKSLAVVEAGALVTVVVPRDARGRLALHYGVTGTHDNLWAVSEGRSAWRFRACEDRATQFNGVFIVAGPQCATIEVLVEGASAPVRAAIPFGVPRSSCTTADVR